MTKVLSRQKSKQSHRKVVNSKEDDVPGFPPLDRRQAFQYTTKQIHVELVALEIAAKEGRIKSSRLDQAQRDWLTNAHVKGEIDDEQLRLFWPGVRDVLSNR